MTASKVQRKALKDHTESDFAVLADISIRKRSRCIDLQLSGEGKTLAMGGLFDRIDQECVVKIYAVNLVPDKGVSCW